MSVPKSKRKQSPYEYIVILQQICIKTIEFNNNENKRIPLLSEKIAEKSLETYCDATRYFEMTIGSIQGNLSEKKKFCKKTIYESRELSALINIFIAERMKENKSVNELVQMTSELNKVVELLVDELKHFSNLD